MEIKITLLQTIQIPMYRYTNLFAVFIMMLQGAIIAKTNADILMQPKIMNLLRGVPRTVCQSRHFFVIFCCSLLFYSVLFCSVLFWFGKHNQHKRMGCKLNAKNYITVPAERKKEQQQERPSDPAELPQQCLLSASLSLSRFFWGIHKVYCSTFCRCGLSPSIAKSKGHP